MVPLELDIDASVTIDTPVGQFTLTGWGSSVGLEVGGGAGVRRLVRLRGAGRRYSGKVAEALESSGLTLYITSSGRRIVSLGSGVRESGLLGLAGIRGIQIYYGALLRSGLS